MSVVEDAPYPRAPIGEIRRNEATGKPEMWITLPWGIFIRDLREDLDATPIEEDSFEVTGQDASIGATTIVTPEQTGYYSFTYYAAITTAGTTSSSLTVAISWTDGGVVKSKTFTAITGNTIATTQSETYLMAVDAAAPITYTTTYASNAAGEMKYTLFGIVNSISS